MISPSILNHYLPATFPFLSYKLHDFVGLDFILAHNTSFSRTFNIYLPSMVVFAMVVRSHMKARVGGCFTSAATLGPLRGFSADSTGRLMVAEKRMTNILQHVAMPPSNLCNLDFDTDLHITATCMCEVTLVHKHIFSHQKANGRQIKQRCAKIYKNGYLTLTFDLNTNRDYVGCIMDTTDFFEKLYFLPL